MLSFLFTLLWLPQALTPAAVQPSAFTPSYVPQRVYDTRRRVFADFETMVADLARADVVFVGEQHDDPNTHRLEAAILDGLRRRGVVVTLSLEMFERDTQPILNTYLSGAVAEAEFLKASRPWPRYAIDYRPLVETARAEGWPVIAANVPRRFASSVAKTGLSALDALTPVERSWAAVDVRCPRDAYFDRFAATMSGHGTAPARAAGDKAGTDDKTKADRAKADAAKPDTAKPDTAKKEEQDRQKAERETIERYYFSQCVKDETMAEAIALGFEQHNRKPVVHVNGAFHSDFGQGTADRVRRRLGGRRVAVVSVLPVRDLDTLAPKGDDLQRADYLLYTLDTRK